MGDLRRDFGQAPGDPGGQPSWMTSGARGTRVLVCATSLALAIGVCLGSQGSECPDGEFCVIVSIYGRCTGLLPQPRGNVAGKDLHESASAAQGVRLSNPMTVLLFIAPDSE